MANPKPPKAKKSEAKAAPPRVAPRKGAPAPSAANAEVTTKPAAAPTPELSITISGHEHIVRRAVTALSFTAEWNRIVTRRIAIEQTLTPGAGLDDALDGPVLHMTGQDDRDLYVQRCVDEASRRGHPVADPSTIPGDTSTTVMEVGDALFDNSAH